MLIETLPAAFEMDEILWELKDHSAGLNCGRWDYIFSFIKTLREDPKAVMPDRCRLASCREAADFVWSGGELSLQAGCHASLFSVLNRGACTELSN